MYEDFYNFKEKPFQVLSDPSYFFMSHAHENAFTHLEYGIIENKGFIVITGEIGSGKTTLINFLLSKIENNIQVGLINYTLVSHENLIKMICWDFDIPTKGLDEVEILDAFYQYLLYQFSEGKRVLLIIDEAQNLDGKSLEKIRMLSNFEMNKQHLFQLILVGQPELKKKLQKKTLEQLSQRISVFYHISSLNIEEVNTYIQHRLHIAGAKNLDIFLKESIDLIAIESRGIPRKINLLCDKALVYGFADGLYQIGRKVIEDIVKEKEDLEKENSLFNEQTFLHPEPEEINIYEKMQKLEERLAILEKQLNLQNIKLEKDFLLIDMLKILQENFKDRHEQQKNFFRYWRR